jgi:amidase
MAHVPLHYESLLDLSSKLKDGDVSPVAVTKALLDRIATLDGDLKSYTSLAADRALARAETAKAEIDRGFWRGPLHGVPIAVKDLCYTSFAPTSAGMHIHKDFVPNYSATVVDRFERAGAIILGKLTMTEGAYCAHHPKMPKPVNPWNAGVWTGASSSGSGVATAAGLCYGSLGSDTGGSIRLPTAACGLSGLKPTWGRVSRYGVFALSESLDHVGPMARTAADCAALLAVIAGADPNDPTATSTPVPDYLAGLSGSLRGLRIGVDEAFIYEGVDPEVAAVVKAALEAFVELGAVIVPVVFPDTTAVPQAWVDLCAVETAIAHEATFPARAEEYGPEIAAFIAKGREVAALDLGKAQIVRQGFKGRLAEMFSGIDVFLVPVIPGKVPTTPEWDEIAKGDFGEMVRYTAVFNFTGNPTLTLNGGFDSRGVPIGFQLVGPHFSEEVLLKAGHAFQTITDWHTQHPMM